MEASMVSATPLMTPTKEVSSDDNNNNDNKTANEHELQFYDPHAVLRTVSREVAFGYLILLTGGNFEYKAPTLPENQSGGQQQQQQESKDEAASPTLDEETSQLAYASIVDGNVLHAVFGLKASPNGKANHIINEKSKSSILCCLPSSTIDALEFILPQSTKNKVKMQQLVEALQEVRDLYHDSLEVPEDTSASFTLHMEVIQAYINCFAAIASYHDQVSLLEKLNGKDSMLDNVIIFKSKKKKQKDKKIEELQKATLNEIESGFNGLREKIWEKLEQTTGATAAISVTSG
mmetsp:Transcript_36966/g.75362  ORF Transcript_36966/g.75362 Transcript_36966/m.75362 type:complete len:291 (+) Transcript_36966:138-1010(+)